MKLQGSSVLVFAVGITAVLVSGCSNKRVESASTKRANASQTRTDGKPKIVALEKEHDFGQVKQGTILEHVFRIRNQGDRQLVIEKAHGSWGCTATLVSTKAVPPGGETQIKASVNTSGRRGDLKKTVSVVSNDPETPKLTLVLKAEIVTDLIVTPYAISFGQLASGEKAEKDVAIQSSDPKRIRIVSLDIEDKRFRLKLKSKKAGTEHYTVRFLGSRTLERISTALEVKYQGSDKTSMRIPVMLTVVGDLIFPKYLFFYKRDKAFSPREVTFSSRSSKPFKLISAKDPDGLLKFTVTKSSGPRATLRVEVANPSTSYLATKRGVFTVKTNRRDENPIKIDYSIVERPIPSVKKLSKSVKPKPIRPPSQ